MTHTMRYRISAVVASLALLVLGFASAGAASADTSTPAAPATGTSSVTNLAPPPTAPLSVWKAWAEKANANMRAMPIEQEAEQAGCTVRGLTYTDLQAGKNTDLPIPAGVSLTSMSMVIHCPEGATNPFTANAIPADVTIPGTPMVMRDGKVVPVSASRPNGGVQPLGVACAQITNGRACNGLQTSGGNPVITASYTYQASGSATGHTELSSNTPGVCQVGQLEKNGGGITLYNGDTQLISIPKVQSKYWVTTWWESAGGGFSNWGNACYTW